MAAPPAGSEPPAFDLRSLYAAADDPALGADLAAARERARAFRAAWHGRIAPGEISATELAGALREWEAIHVQGRRPTFYASLRFAADTQDTTAQQLLEHAREAWTVIESELVFFTVELTRMPEERFAPLIVAAELADARHFLDHIRRERPHTLGEGEERVIVKKNLAGRDAFGRLFEELTASFRFALDVDGETRSLTGEEMLSLLSHPDRTTRATAYRTYLQRFAEHALPLTTIFNSVVLDHRLECELRHYDDLAAPTHHENEVSAEIVEGLMAATEQHYAMARRYFAIKARLLGVERLAVTDLYAPLDHGPRDVPYTQARQMILDAFGAFSPEFRAEAAAFFEHGWIDAAVRPGKSGGAFCSAHAPGTNPFIVLSYTGTIRDVATLAHELGHGIHDRLAAGQRYVNYDPPLTLAETASVFAEMLLTRHLLAGDLDPTERRGVLCAAIEEIIATVFRQNVLTRFELAAHEARRHAQLTAADLGNLWWDANAALYGDAVEMPPEYRWGWSYIPHFIHSRFYCYAYVFGELLALTLYQRHLDEGPRVLPEYLRLLAAGGSDAPAALLARLDCDIASAAFWDRGFRVIQTLLDDLEATGTGG
jgi:oligoendopeptidase F